MLIMKRNMKFEAFNVDVFIALCLRLEVGFKKEQICRYVAACSIFLV